MWSWQRSLSLPVVTPGRTWGAMKSSTSEARRPAMRMRSMSSGLFRTTAIRLIMLEFWADFANCTVKSSRGPNRVFESTGALPNAGQAADPNPKEKLSVSDDASNAGSRGPFRTPDPVLEPEDGAVHLRPPQQDPHHQPGKDPAALPGRAQVRAHAGGKSADHSLRGHQAPGARNPARRGDALPDAVRRSPLARRHAHQFQDREAVDQAPEGDGGDAGGRQLRAHFQEGSA